MNLADKAYDLIRKDILACIHAPGQQIAQGQLAEKYGLGMTPVREALQRLSHEGLIQAVPRSGYVVSLITLSDVRELFELRDILESAAVRLAVERASEAQLDHILEEANFTYVFHDRDDYTRFLDRNYRFHCLIAATGGNQRLIDTLARTLDGLTRVFHLGLDLRDSADEMRNEHLALAQALKDRDAERGAAIVSSQISRSIQRVIEALTHSIDLGLVRENGQLTHTIIFGEKPS
jgi:DNA-binding GntR family transcriptional regulator